MDACGVVAPGCPLSLVGCKLGHPWIGWTLACPVKLGCGGFGDLVLLNSFCGVTEHIVLLGRPLPIGSAVAIRGFTLKQCLGGFSNGILHWRGIISSPISDFNVVVGRCMSAPGVVCGYKHYINVL